MKKVSVLLLLGMVCLAGCGKKEVPQEPIQPSPPSIVEEKEETEVVEPTTKITEESLEDTSLKGFNADITIEEIKAMYPESDDSDYIKPFYNVEQSTQFTFKFNSNVEPCFAVTVHTDPSCNQDSMVYQINDGYRANDGVYVVVKPGSPVLESASRPIDNYNWGFAPIYYLSINYDMDSNEVKKLDEPIIIPFTVKSDVSVPTVKAVINDVGEFGLQWNKIDDAVKYNIYEAFAVRDSSEAYNMPRSACAFVGDHLELLTTVDASVTNFNDFHLDNTTNKLLTDEGYVQCQNFYGLNSYYVTAVDKNGNESFYSYPVEGWQYANQLPKSLKTTYSTLKELPLSVQVEMVDNTVTTFPCEYVLKEESDYEVIYEYSIVGTSLTGKVNISKEKGKDYPKEVKSDYKTVESLYDVKDEISLVPTNDIKTIIDETYDETTIDLISKVDFDEATKIKYDKDAIMLRADLESARIITDGIYTKLDSISTYISSDDSYKVGANPLDIVYEEGTSLAFAAIGEDLKKIDATNMVSVQRKSTANQVQQTLKTSIKDTELTVFADSAEEYYIAVQMMNGVKTIDLKAFPRLQDTNYLSDVVTKVYVQNPYIIDMDYFFYDGYTQSLQVYYVTESDIIIKKQKQLATQVEEIVAKTVRDDMSVDDKLECLWNYLELSTEYDFEGYSTIQYYQMGKLSDVPAIYVDDFNAFGVLCKNKGVCQGYSAAFKLLCEKAGIQTTIITGYIEKVLPHQWNAVYVDGAWRWFDITNNRNTSGIPYMMYATSSDYSVLGNYIVSSKYALDKDVKKILNSDASKDWYVVNKTVSKDDDELVKNVVDTYFESDARYDCIKASYPVDLNSGIKQRIIDELMARGVSDAEIEQIGFTYTMGYIILTH